ncbi:MAG: hypothetical protein HKN23_11605 [Verrucomicrobiales bacterium]|nr:hypothetical protein [Verrucomicrobiales bacterium]
MTLNPDRAKKLQRGSALIAVFWAIAVLGMVIFGAAKFVSLDSEWVTGMRKTALATRHAETGLAYGSHPQIQPGDPRLGFDEGAEGGYRVLITKEEGLIPINAILLGQQKSMVKRLFRSWGMEERAAAAVTDALADWVDANDFVNLNGAERDAYAARGIAGMPLNRPFQSVDEMKWVIGMDAVDRVQPGWRNWFTVHSTNRIDLNEAPADSIAAVTGIPIESAKAAVLRRSGADGVSGTIDDIRFLSVAEALQVLGVVFDPNGGFPDFFTVDGTTPRIVSEGFFGDVGKRIVEVQGANGSRIWRWEEAFSIEN